MKSAARLLVVEQEEQVRKLLQTTLTRSGYEVQTAGTGEEAIETMNTSSGFDAVLAEAALPGMNGHELARHLAVRYPSTKVIFVTATHVECEVCPTLCSACGSPSRLLRKNWSEKSAKSSGIAAENPIEEIEMHKNHFEHLTRREWKEILRWRAWQAKITLDKAVEARRKAIAIYRESVTLEQWAGLKQALGTESKARQKYDEALADYDSPSPSPSSSMFHC